MKSQLSLAGGVAVGAGLMYFLDPERGKRRRAVVRDKTRSASTQSRNALGKVGRDMRNRTAGAVANIRSLGSRGEAVDEQVLVARVRSKLGRYVSHPHAIEVIAEGDRVTLRGPILAQEASRLLSGLRSVAGLREVENHLTIHSHAGEVPELQGGRSRLGQVPEIMQTNWTPALRVMAGAAGCALATFGALRRDPASLFAGFVGLGMFTRAASNIEVSRLIPGRRPVEIHKTVRIEAPVAEVFDFWTNFESFPRLLPHLREIRDLGHGRSRWKAAGPAGAAVTWEAEITHMETDRVLAWKTTPDSMLENEGTVHFEPVDGNACRVDIRMSYYPPAGAAGDAVAWMFGRDLKTEISDALARMKLMLEEGVRSRGPVNVADLRPAPRSV